MKAHEKSCAVFSPIMNGCKRLQEAFGGAIQKVEKEKGETKT